jgi:hypothetical protein
VRKVLRVKISSASRVPSCTFASFVVKGFPLCDSAPCVNRVLAKDAPEPDFFLREPSRPWW